MEAKGIQMTLDAPVWGAHWFPQLAQLCNEHPRLLPQAADLLRRAEGGTSESDESTEYNILLPGVRHLLFESIAVLLYSSTVFLFTSKSIINKN
jgi:hypothetical protein